jgi:hypothetical protein
MILERPWLPPVLREVELRSDRQAPRILRELLEAKLRSQVPPDITGVVRTLAFLPNNLLRRLVATRLRSRFHAQGHVLVVGKEVIAIMMAVMVYTAPEKRPPQRRI